MKATETNFLKFLQGTKQFIIPIYQRIYSWRISDCQQLWDDILRVAEDDQIPAHFLGSVVYVSGVACAPGGAAHASRSALDGYGLCRC